MKLEVSPWFEAPVALPEGAQEFAVGDVHGHVAQFGALLDAMRMAGGPDAHLTLLGDLIDRGPASLAALRLAAIAPPALGFARHTTLLGNHEMAMLLALGGGPEAPDAQELWLANGGDTTLAEAGVAPAALALRAGFARASLRLAAGPAAFEMLEKAELARLAGNLVFVHGGIDPGAPLEATLACAPRLALGGATHPAWIREGFLDHDGPFEGGRIVVHGHTPEPRVLRSKGRREKPGFHRLDGSRLGLDGGSYATGMVAGAEFRRGGYRVFVASIDPD